MVEIQYDGYQIRNSLTSRVTVYYVLAYQYIGFDDVYSFSAVEFNSGLAFIKIKSVNAQFLRFQISEPHSSLYAVHRSIFVKKYTPAVIAVKLGNSIPHF